MGMSMYELEGQAALGTTNINNSLVVAPWKLHCKSPRDCQALRRHCLNKRFKVRFIGVSSGIIAGRSVSGVRFARSQRRSEKIPSLEKLRVKKLKLGADVARPVFVEIERCFGCVGVTTVLIALQQTDCHQYIKE